MFYVRIKDCKKEVLAPFSVNYFLEKLVSKSYFYTLQKQSPGGVLRNLTKFTGKHLWQSLFFNKVAGLIEKETLAQVFSCEFCQISKNIFSYKIPPMAASDTGIFKNSFLFYGQS